MAMQLISKFLLLDSRLCCLIVSAEYSNEFVFDLKESLIGDITLYRKTNNVGIIIEIDNHP